jgi:hypothetical protein
MKRMLIAGLLLAGVVVAQDVFLKGDELAKEIADKCESGCIVLNHEEAATLVRNITNVVEEKEKEAFGRGKLYCRNAT